MSVDDVTAYFATFNRRPLLCLLGLVGPETGARTALLNGFTKTTLSSVVGDRNGCRVGRAIGAGFQRGTLRFYAYP